MKNIPSCLLNVLAPIMFLLMNHGLYAQFDEHYDTNNSGIPFNTVYSIAIDRDNVKWIGTDYGLARFDGVNWQTFNTNNSGIPDNSVRSLAFDNAGNLWVGTYLAGAAKYDGNTWTVYNHQNSSLPDDYVRCITQDSVGAMCFGTTGGLAIFDGADWTVYNQFNTPVMRSSNIASIGVDENNVLWLGTVNGGLNKLDNGTMSTFYNGNSPLTDNTILGMCIDTAGNIWNVHPTGGVTVHLPNGGWVRITQQNTNIATNSYNDVVFSHGLIYLASQFSGLILQSPPMWDHLYTGNSNLPEDQLLCAAVDTSGRIWLGTFNSGAVVFDPSLYNGVGALPIGAGGLTVYPNPATDQVLLQLPHNKQVHQWAMFDLMGKVVLNGQLAPNQFSIGLAGLPQGMYQVVVTTQNGENYTEKIMVH